VGGGIDVASAAANNASASGNKHINNGVAGSGAHGENGAWHRMVRGNVARARGMHGMKRNSNVWRKRIRRKQKRKR